LGKDLHKLKQKNLNILREYISKLSYSCTVNNTEQAVEIDEVIKV